MPETLVKMNPATAAKLKAMLRSNVVDKYGDWNFPGLEMCGKTGTAQTDRGKDHSWFTCFAPEKAPRIVVTVVVEQGGFGASAALPVARAVLIEADKSGRLR